MQKEKKKNSRSFTIFFFFFKQTTSTVGQVVQNWTLNNFVLLALIYLWLYLKYSE